jgi:GT2 family glycosyltransferase
MSTPLVSIVVPTFERPDLLAACLESIASTTTLDHEVIVVPVDDDAPTRAMLATRAARVVMQPRAEGYVRAANLGLRAARGTYVTVINDDCTLLPHTIDNAVRFLQAPAHARIGLAALFHDTPSPRNVHAQIDVDGIRYVVRHVRGLCYADFGLGRRDLLARLGFFDECFVMYGADPDLSLRVWHDAGLEVVPCPGALVHHACTPVDPARQADDNRRLFEKWAMASPMPAPLPI